MQLWIKYSHTVNMLSSVLIALFIAVTSITAPCTASSY